MLLFSTSCLIPMPEVPAGAVLRRRQRVGFGTDSTRPSPARGRRGGPVPVAAGSPAPRLGYNIDREPGEKETKFISRSDRPSKTARCERKAMRGSDVRNRRALDRRPAGGADGRGGGRRHAHRIHRPAEDWTGPWPVSRRARSWSASGSPLPRTSRSGRARSTSSGTSWRRRGWCSRPIPAREGKRLLQRKFRTRDGSGRTLDKELQRRNSRWWDGSAQEVVGVIEKVGKERGFP